MAARSRKVSVGHILFEFGWSGRQVGPRGTEITRTNEVRSDIEAFAVVLGCGSTWMEDRDGWGAIMGRMIMRSLIKDK